MSKQINFWNNFEVKDRFFFCFSVIVIIILIVAVLQIQSVSHSISMASKSMERNSKTHISNGFHDLHEIFINKPELWPFFKNGKKISKNDKKYYSVLALADVHLNLMESIWIQTSHKKQYQYQATSSSEPVWENWLKSVVEKSPIMCTRISQVKEWYSEGFVKYINQPCDL